MVETANTTRQPRSRSGQRRVFSAALLGIALMGLGCFVWAVSLCGSAVFQEGNPVPYALAITHLKRLNEEITPVKIREGIWLQANKQEPAERDAMTRMVARQGWRLDDQMGAARYYKRGTGTLKVIGRMYSGKYLVFQARLMP